MAVRIITDSGSDILPGEMEGLVVLPLTIAFGNDVYHDGVDLSHERFFELLTESTENPTTGQVPPFRYSQAFDEIVNAGDEAVVITLSSGVSGTWESACTAAAEHPDKIHVVDSQHVSVGIRLLVEMALDRAARGATADEIVTELEASKGKIRFLALLDTLEYLRRGGRISNVSAALGSILAIKPVITCTDGKVVVMEKPRGLKNGRGIVADLIRKDGGFDFTRPLCIGYTGLTDKPVRSFLESCTDLWEGKGEVPVSSIGATIGTHAGPGGFLLAYFGNEA
ncbi:MAG: DegV family protein [Acidobacteriota bacterium]|nr:DegV family protein [Acidobacteriota bacterium]